MIAELPKEEKQLAVVLVKRDAFAFAKHCRRCWETGFRKFVFGMGVFGMAFSTIIILMLINGFAF